MTRRPWEIGRASLQGELKKIARYKKLENLCSVFQNGHAFLGSIQFIFGSQDILTYLTYDDRVSITKTF